MANFKHTILTPTRVTKGKYGNQIVLEGVERGTGFYYLAQGEILSITFPNTIELSFSTNSWNGTIQILLPGSTASSTKGYAMNMTGPTDARKTSTWNVSFLGGKTYKFIGLGRHDTELNTHMTTGGIVAKDGNWLYPPKLIYNHWFKTSADGTSDIPTGHSKISMGGNTVRNLVSKEHNNIATLTPKVLTFKADHDFEYHSNALFGISTDKLNNPFIIGHHYRTSAIATTSSGTGQFYTQPVRGYSNVQVYYPRDTHANNIDNAWNVMSRIPIENFSDISLKYKRGTYSVSSGWSDYKITVRRFDSTGAIYVSEHATDNAPRKLMPGQHELVKTLNGTGSWIQLWIYNYDGMHYGFKMGAGSGSGTAFTCFIEQVRTDGYVWHKSAIPLTDPKRVPTFYASYDDSYSGSTLVIRLHGYANTGHSFSKKEPLIINTNNLIPHAHPNKTVSLSDGSSLFDSGITIAKIRGSTDLVHVKDIKRKYLRIGFFNLLGQSIPYLMGQSDNEKDLRPINDE